MFSSTNTSQDQERRRANEDRWFNRDYLKCTAGIFLNSGKITMKQSLGCEENTLAQIYSARQAYGIKDDYIPGDVAPNSRKNGK